ncbi:MAG: quinolinate synthase NadA, partial [Desulfofustis sp.]|nr:quinolinate synthase NadA [Desulfofustis sp.]
MSDTKDHLAAYHPPAISIPPHPEWPELSAEDEQDLKRRISALLKEQNGVLVAHYYTDARLQDLAEETGGCVADSLEMARFGTEHPA